MDRPSTSRWRPQQQKSISQSGRELLQGSLGQKLQLITNYYRVSLAKRTQDPIHVYTLELSINGVIKKGKAVCQELFWSAVLQFPNIFEDYCRLVYDNAKTLYCASPILDFKRREIVCKRDRLGWQFAHVPAGHSSELRVHIALTKVDEFVLQQKSNLPLTNQQLQFLQAMYSQCVRCPMFGQANNWFTVSTKIYRIPFEDAYTPIELGDCMVVLRGLRCAFKLDSQGLPLFNSDLAHCVVAKVNLEIIDFYAMLYDTILYERDKEKLTEYTMNQTQMNRLDAALKGITLKATYAPYHPKYLRLVPYDQPPFQEPQLGLVTVQEYFQRRYRKKLRFPKMPLVQVHPPSKKIFIPMELLTISDEVQKIRKRLRPDALATLVRKTAYSPPERFRMIEELVEDSQLCSNPFSDKFGVAIDREMVQLQGRLLPKPVIFGGNQRSGLVNALNKTLALAVVCINGAMFPNSAIQNWIHLCINQGVSFVQDSPFHVSSYYLRAVGGEHVEERYDISHFREHLQSVRQKGAKCYPTAESLFVFVVKDNNPDYIYDFIKTRCELELGIMSQVIKIRTLKRMQADKENPMGDKATLHNMLLKINCKLEGANKKVADCHGWSKFIDKSSPTLFLGVDAIHPSRDENMPSIAAVTANLDVEVTRFYGWFDVFSLEEGNRKELPQLEGMFEAALDTFYNKNKQAPGHIVILRDGVSDSEIGYLSQMEMGELGNACREFIKYYKLTDYKPTISYLVIQKKHGTRFWQAEQKDWNTTSRHTGNVPSGTVVDTVITGALSSTDGQLRNAQDFFLCSQEGRLGTSRPAHYTLVEPLNPLHDTWRLTADEWQSCMFGLCHLVGRSSAVVSIPAPIYYADLLCTRARRYVHTYRREERDDFDTINVQKRLESSMWWT